MASILLVEDDDTIARVLRDKFQKVGYSVSVAENGAIGLSHALREKPDLIVLDILMPAMDGLSMLKQLRADVWGRTARVIIVSNVGTDESVLTSEEYGVRYYVEKSGTTLQDLLRHVDTTLKEK